MKANFSFKRYQMLLTKELKERSTMILKLAGIMSVIIIGIWLTSILITGGEEISPVFRFGMMSTLLVVAMIIAPFNLYKSYNHPKKGIDYALLPASVCEKYLSMLTIVVIITPLVMILSLFITDIFLSLITPSVFPGFALNANNLGMIDISSIYEILILQWAFMFGNFLFKKSKVTKSMFAVIGIYLFLGLMLASTVKVVFAEEINQVASFSVQIHSLDDLLNSPALEEAPAMKLMMYIIYAVTYVVIPVGSLSGTFLKMKNQQY